jgi:hypothetical protein
MAHFFWYRGALKPLAAACIRSFLVNGFDVTVWTYDADLRLPQLRDGPFQESRVLRGRRHVSSTIGDATLMFPERFKQTITQNKVVGSLSGFSNMLRYRILAAYGGWWFDTDLFCMRSVWSFVNLTRGITLGSLTARAATPPAVVAGLQDHEKINGAVLYLRNRSMGVLLEQRANESLTIRNRSVVWGTLGPRLITSVVGQELKLLRECLPPSIFYPISWKDWRILFDKQHVGQAWKATRSAYTVHLWNEHSKHYAMQRGSLVDILFRRYAPTEAGRVGMWGGVLLLHLLRELEGFCGGERPRLAAVTLRSDLPAFIRPYTREV